MEVDRPHRIALLLAMAFVVISACTKQSSIVPPPSGGTGLPTTAPPTTPASSTSTAAGGPLPAGCHQGRPAARDTVAFVAEGFAWSLGPDGSNLTCLFPVRNPGPFQWGPLGDRALLGGLQMEQIGGKELHPTTSAQPVATSWGHPMGLAVVFVSRNGQDLEKAYPGRKTIDDISPLGRDKTVTYKNVIYHPSGLALAFVATTDAGDSIYLSSNLGADPQRLVFSLSGTTFGPLDFSPDGRTLAYGAEHQNGRPAIHELDLTQPDVAPEVWVGDQGEHIQSVNESPRESSRFLGATLGSSCADAQSVVIAKRKATPALPDESRPTRTLGWLDGTHILVAAGGCGEKLDISSVDVRTMAVLPLAYGVAAAAVRTPAPTPAPDLPNVTQQQVGTGVG